MGHGPGTGRREAAILAALDGVPRDIGELTAEIVGRKPTKSEYNTINKAAHMLAEHGVVKITRVPRGKGGPGPRRSILLKVGRWLQDSDAAAGTDAQASHQQWLDRAWTCFASDYRYAEEICEVATKLGERIGDDDSGAADEVLYPLGVVDVEAG